MPASSSTGAPEATAERPATIRETCSRASASEPGPNTLAGEIRQQQLNTLLGIHRRNHETRRRWRRQRLIDMPPQPAPDSMQNVFAIRHGLFATRPARR